MNKKNELSHYEKQAMQRINSLIAKYCEGSQQRFSEMTGINKGSISQYCNGKNSPSNLTAKKIADKFKLNPAWVMGFDVPMVDNPTTPSNDPFDLFNEQFPFFDTTEQASPKPPQEPHIVDDKEYELIEKYRLLSFWKQQTINHMMDDLLYEEQHPEPFEGQQTIFDFLPQDDGKNED